VFFRTPDDPPAPEPAGPAEPDLDESAAAAAALHIGLLQMRESLTPVFDAADGMRADLRARGWSEVNAEIITVTWTQRLVMNLTPLIGGLQ
jgi:hypothetical protein